MAQVTGKASIPRHFAAASLKPLFLQHTACIEAGIPRHFAAASLKRGISLPSPPFGEGIPRHFAAASLKVFDVFNRLL